MNIVALETSTGANSVGVVCGLGTPQERWSVRTHARDIARAETLLLLVNEAMREANLSFDDIDLIAASTGPGSFTAIRTGLAAAKGLALAAGKPVVGATSLDIVAADVVATGARGPFAVAMDAGKGELYVATYRSTGRQITSPRLIDRASCPSVIDPSMQAIAGPAALIAVDWLANAAPPPQVLSQFATPSARRLAVMAPTLPRGVRPTYLRAADTKPPASPNLLRPTP